MFFAIPAEMLADVKAMETSNTQYKDIYFEEDAELRKFYRQLETTGPGPIKALSTHLDRFVDLEKITPAMLVRFPYINLIYRVKKLASEDLGSYVNGEYKIGYCKGHSSNSTDLVRAVVHNIQRSENLLDFKDELRRVKQLTGSWDLSFLYSRSTESSLIDSGIQQKTAQFKAKIPESFCFTKLVR